MKKKIRYVACAVLIGICSYFLLPRVGLAENISKLTVGESVSGASYRSVSEISVLEPDSEITIGANIRAATINNSNKEVTMLCVEPPMHGYHEGDEITSGIRKITDEKLLKIMYYGSLGYEENKHNSDYLMSLVKDFNAPENAALLITHAAAAKRCNELGLTEHRAANPEATLPDGEPVYADDWDYALNSTGIRLVNKFYDWVDNQPPAPAGVEVHFVKYITANYQSYITYNALPSGKIKLIKQSKN